MSREIPMSVLEEAEFRFHCARVEHLRGQRRQHIESSRAAQVVPADQRSSCAATVHDGRVGQEPYATSGPEATALQGTSWDPTLPAFLRKQAD